MIVFSKDTHFYSIPLWASVAKSVINEPIESLNNAVAENSSSANAGFLSDHTSEGLSVTCGWSWAAPGHCPFSFHHIMLPAVVLVN